MQDTNLFPVVVKGKLGDVTFDDIEPMYLSDEVIRYLYELGVDFKDENNFFAAIEDINSTIKCLFALDKHEQAWKAINANLDDVDFLEIMQCPYFVLDRSATKVYKYMYDKGLFDDDTYVYFNVICGEFFDKDFMYKYLGTCTTRKEFFDKLHDAYNGYDATTVGLIEYSPELRQMFESFTEDAEDLSAYIVGKLQTIEFSSDDIIEFIKKGYIDDPRYTAVALRAIYERSNCIDEEKDCMDKAWKMFFTEYDYTRVLADLRFDILEFTKSFIDAVKTYIPTKLMDEYTTSGIAYAFLNSPAFYFYPHTIINEFNDMTRTYIINSIKKVFINDVNPSIYENSYIVENISLSGMEGFADKFIRSPYYVPWRLIFNKETHQLYSGRWCADGKHAFKTYEGDELAEGLDWILNDVEAPDWVFETFNSKEEYEEARLALKSAALSIEHHG